MKLCASNLRCLRQIHAFPTHFFISIVAIHSDINAKRARRYWRKLIKAARHKSSKEFFDIFYAINSNLWSSQLMLEQTHDGWNLFSKVARWQKEKSFKVVYQSMDKKTLADVLQQRNSNGASAFGLAARYQSPASFGLFLRYIKSKNLTYSLFNSGTEHTDILLNHLLTYQSAKNIKMFIKMIDNTELIRVMRQHNHNKDNAFNLFFSDRRSKKQIESMLHVINRPRGHKYYQRAVKRALLKTNKQGWHALHHIAYRQSAELFEEIIQRFDTKTSRRMLGRRTKNGENILNLVISSEQPIKKLKILYRTFNASDVNKVLLKKNRNGWSPFMQVLREENPYLVTYVLQKIDNNAKLLNLTHDESLTAYEQEWLSRMIVKNTARNIFSSVEPKPIDKKVIKIVAEYKSVFTKEILHILKAKHDGLSYIKKIKFMLHNKQKLDHLVNKEDKRIDTILTLIRTKPAKKTYKHFRPVLFKRHKKYRQGSFASAIREIDLVLGSFENQGVQDTVERSLTPRVFEFVA